MPKHMRRYVCTYVRALKISVNNPSDRLRTEAATTPVQKDASLSFYFFGKLAAIDPHEL